MIAGEADGHMALGSVGPAWWQSRLIGRVETGRQARPGCLGRIFSESLGKARIDLSS